MIDIKKIVPSQCSNRKNYVWSSLTDLSFCKHVPFQCLLSQYTFNLRNWKPRRRSSPELEGRATLIRCRLQITGITNDSRNTLRMEFIPLRRWLIQKHMKAKIQKQFLILRCSQRSILCRDIVTDLACMTLSNDLEKKNPIRIWRILKGQLFYVD